jgi:lipid A 4'-phosphatase
MLIRPSIAFFLIFTFVVGPGLVVNGLVKAYWARPRPDFVQQFGGHEHFKPWWKPGGDCVRNCSFVSGEAAEMFWLLAPASVATAAIAPIALTAATVSAAGLSVLRFVFGRHFTIDVIFGAVLIVLIVTICNRIFLRMPDDKLEQKIERFAVLLRSPRAWWGRRLPRNVH